MVNYIETTLDDLKSAVNVLKEKFSDCSVELSKCDKEISDILHYIEFTKLNASQGYKACSMLKERLLKRRVIKDEMSEINVLFSTGFNQKNIDSAMKGMEKLAVRNYTPRVLNELFDENHSTKKINEEKRKEDE